MKLTADQLTALRAVPPLPGQNNKVGLALFISQSRQVDIVQAAGLNAPYVNNVVWGRFSTVSLPNARKFAAFFGCSIEDLFPDLETKAAQAPDAQEVA